MFCPRGELPPPTRPGRIDEIQGLLLIKLSLCHLGEADPSGRLHHLEHQQEVLLQLVGSVIPLVHEDLVQFHFLLRIENVTHVGLVNLGPTNRDFA